MESIIFMEPSENFRKSVKLGQRVKLMIFWTMVFCIVGSVVYADPDGPSLTHIFNTRAFQGSWEVIQKFNFIGYIMNFLISLFCLIGMCLTFFARVTTLVYLSSRNLWDTVNEIKQGSKGTGFMGFKGLFDNTMKGSYGGGLDNLLGFFYGLLPNIKHYSDYPDSGMTYAKLSEDDTAMTYMLKMLPQTVILMFLFTMGFNGSLGRCFGTLVDGMSAFADNVIAVNIAGMVDDVFSMGSAGKTVLGKDGSYKGKKQARLAMEVKAQIVGKYGVRGDDVAVMYDAIQVSISQNVTRDSVNRLLKDFQIQEDKDWKNVSLDAVVSDISNTNQDCITIPLKDIGFNSANNACIFIFARDNGSKIPDMFDPATPNKKK